jgi:predicted DNA binding CopG/RHH family protein
MVFLGRKSTTMKTKFKPMPSLVSDADTDTDTDTDTERIVETADLSTYDLSGFKPMNFEFEPKTAALNMRLPQNLLEALKVKAKGIPYSRYVRLLLESDVAR